MPLMVVCLVPAAPVLLPRLTGSRVPEVAPVREAVRQALGALAGLDRVVVVSEDVPGTLAGFGATATLGVPPPAEPGGTTVDPPSWPRQLADELLDDELPDGLPDDGLFDGGWPDGGRPDGGRPDGGPLGARPVREHRGWLQGTPDLLVELDTAPDRVGLLLLADGSRTRGPRAPGGQDPRGDVVDAELLAALEQGRAADVPDAPLVGARAEAAVALLAAAPGGPTRVLHHEAPLGVAYLVAVRRRVGG